MTTRPEFQSAQFEKGLKIRKEVLGAEHVQKSLDSATDFTAPMQKLVTEWCWGELWSRPGLDRRTRSIINLSMLSALNRPHEVRLHVERACAAALPLLPPPLAIDEPAGDDGGR